MSALKAAAIVVTLLAISCHVNAATWYINNLGSETSGCGTAPSIGACKYISSLNPTLLNSGDIITIEGTVEHRTGIAFGAVDWDKNLNFVGVNTAIVKIVNTGLGDSGYFGTYVALPSIRYYSFRNIAFTGATLGLFRGSTPSSGWQGTLLGFDQCSFYGNTQGQASGAGGVGAFAGSIVLFESCTFSNGNQYNTAQVSGGIVHMIGGNVTFNNPIGMTGASADEYGGAIACLSNAICAIYGTTATAVTISGNSALGKIGIGLGGAIYSEKSVVRIRNVAFSGNNAFYGGGAIALLNGADLECYECSFTGNNAAVATGGALNIYGSVVKFFGVSSFSNNNAKGNGGAIYLSDNGGFENGNPYAIGKLTLNGDVTGKINTAGDSGGFLFAVSADLTLSTSKLSISECTAEKYGGAFSFELDSNVVATSPIALSSNSAKIAGGNFYAVTGAKFTTTSTVTLSSGYAGESGGNLAIMGNVGTGRASFLGAVTMTSGTVASNDIGGITTYSGCNAYFSNAVANFTGGVTFQEGCSANTLPTRSGGEISVIGVSQVRLTNPKFIWSTSITVGTANRAIFGGSIYTSLAAGANFVMTGSSTADCIVQTHPGGPDTFGNAIYIGQGGGNVLISSCTLNGPAPTTNVKEGGTAFFGGSTSLIQNSIIQGGRAKNGGCLYVDANVAIVSTKIEKCVATDYGGALYIYNPNHIVSCSGCTIGSGTAGIEAGIEGGAIYANPNVGGLSLTIADTTITNVKAGGTGSGILVSPGAATITSSRIDTSLLISQSAVTTSGSNVTSIVTGSSAGKLTTSGVTRVGSFNHTGGAVTVNTGSTFTTTAFVWSAGSIAGPGTFIHTGSTGLIVAGVAQSAGLIFKNTGTLSIASTLAITKDSTVITCFTISGTFENAQGGTLQVVPNCKITGSLTNSGTLRSHPTAQTSVFTDKIYIAGTLTLASSSVWNVYFQDFLSDQWDIANAVVGNGVLGVIEATPGIEPAVGVNYPVIAAPTISDTFTSVNVAFTKPYYCTTNVADNTDTGSGKALYVSFTPAPPVAPPPVNPPDAPIAAPIATPNVGAPSSSGLPPSGTGTPSHSAPYDGSSPPSSSGAPSDGGSGGAPTSAPSGTGGGAPSSAPSGNGAAPSLLTSPLANGGSDAPADAPADEQAGGGANVGGIVGGIIGAILGALLIAGIIFLIVRHLSKRDANKSKEVDMAPMPPAADPDPAPPAHQPENRWSRATAQPDLLNV